MRAPSATRRNIYVRSRRAGERVMASVSRFLTNKLRLKVNEAKSAVARPEERKFLADRAKTPGDNKPIWLRHLYRGFSAPGASIIIARGFPSDDFEPNLNSVSSFRTVCKNFAPRESGSKTVSSERTAKTAAGRVAKREGF